MVVRKQRQISECIELTQTRETEKDVHSGGATFTSVGVFAGGVCSPLKGRMKQYQKA